MSDPFKALSANEKPRNLSVPETSEDHGKAIVPIPSDVELKVPHHSLGVPAIIWSYRDEKGHILFRVCRFISDGKKEDRHLTYREYRGNLKKWAWKSVDAPRPIYGLDRLAKNLDAPVIICEGEKATDAATELFPDHVAVTSPNGAGSPHCANWEPLCGREVVIWPDHDEEGHKYAQKVSHILKEAGAKSVRIVTIPDDFEEKWDLADALPEGYTQGDIECLLKEAQPIIDPLEDLVERATDNPGEAYKDDARDALLALRRDDLPAFITLRSELKKAGVGVTMLDTAMNDRCVELGDVPVKPDHLELAHSVINNIGRENLLGTTAHVWRWQDKGVWRPVVDREVKQIVQRTLEGDCDIYRNLIEGVTDVLKTAILAIEHEWNRDLDAVNVLNGELHWDGTQWELKSHCREHYRTTQIPVVYDPQADCPRFKKFLIEIFEVDSDGHDKAQALVEMIGYTLVSHAKFERFALLIGSGANGKSVVMEVVRALVGRENVAAVQPSQFTNKFQRAHLHLKLANLVTEIAEGGQIADAELKAITSGELTTAEHKNKDPFDFCPFCTCWFGANHLPHTRDFSDALFRRALVIPFNRTFKAGVDADPHLKAKLLDELPGIMNLALQAFGSVLKCGNFTEPQSCLDAKQEWRKEADQAAQFVEECCVQDENSEITSSALYGSYKTWAEEAGITRKLNQKNFSNRLVRLGCKLHKGTAGKRMIKGIRIGWER